ncbi:MAG: hypothetical protein IT165_01520 [Bryobacterales bacterium]|nr:hypothetical protein [Bryobacterales bacterium]
MSQSTTPAAYSFGNAGVGIVRGPGMSRVDSSLSKQIRVTERKYFQLRLPAFNVTNAPIFSVQRAFERGRRLADLDLPS